MRKRGRAFPQLCFNSFHSVKKFCVSQNGIFFHSRDRKVHWKCALEQGGFCWISSLLWRAHEMRQVYRTGTRVLTEHLQWVTTAFHNPFLYSRAQKSVEIAEDFYKQYWRSILQKNTTSNPRMVSGVDTISYYLYYSLMWLKISHWM